MLPMKRVLVILFISISACVNAQIDYTWWNKIHHWDGVTSWEKYLTIAPAFLGPNALPVPDMSKGQLDTTMQFEVGGDLHFSKGDHTQDAFVRAYLPFENNKVAISLEVIPIEYFTTDTITRDLRASRGKSGEGKAGGDIYFTTYVQLLKNRKSLPDLTLRAALRTASGTNLGEARYTDGPGYYFDVSAGKTYELSASSSLRWFGMAGLYVYQTFDVDHLQNDCFLFGGGAEWKFRKVSLREELAGYSGYMSNGDKPLVLRSTLQWNASKLSYKFSYQHSLRDFPTERLRLSLVYRFNVRL